MEKILTQEEIDALFRAAQGRASEQAKTPAEERPVAVCNFHQSARISKEQLRTVSQLHELFARNLTHSLGAYLRLAFEVNLVSAEQLNYGEFLQRIPEVTYLVSMALRPMGVSAAIASGISGHRRVAWGARPGRTDRAGDYRNRGANPGKRGENYR